MSESRAKPRKRAARWALTVIRARDLPDCPAPVTPVALDPVWAMIARDYIVWPVPARPGDWVLLSRGCITRHDAADLKPMEVFRVKLTTTDMDRLFAMSPALVCYNAEEVAKMHAFQLSLIAQRVGHDTGNPAWLGRDR